MGKWKQRKWVRKIKKMGTRNYEITEEKKIREQGKENEKGKRKRKKTERKTKKMGKRNTKENVRGGDQSISAGSLSRITPNTRYRLRPTYFSFSP